MWSWHKQIISLPRVTANLMLPALGTACSLPFSLLANSTSIPTSPAEQDVQITQNPLMWEQSDLQPWQGWRDGGLISAPERFSHSSPHSRYFLSAAKIKWSIHIVFHHRLMCVRWDWCLSQPWVILALLFIWWEALGTERSPPGQTMWPRVNFPSLILLWALPSLWPILAFLGTVILSSRDVSLELES